MINPIELIEEYKAQGHSCEESVRMAKAELKTKKATNIKNNIEATNLRINGSRSFLHQD